MFQEHWNQVLRFSLGSPRQKIDIREDSSSFVQPVYITVCFSNCLLGMDTRITDTSAWKILKWMVNTIHLFLCQLLQRRISSNGMSYKLSSVTRFYFTRENCYFNANRTNATYTNPTGKWTFIRERLGINKIPSPLETPRFRLSKWKISIRTIAGRGCRASENYSGQGAC